MVLAISYPARALTPFLSALTLVRPCAVPTQLVAEFWSTVHEAKKQISSDSVKLELRGFDLPWNFCSLGKTISVSPVADLQNIHKSYLQNPIQLTGRRAGFARLLPRRGRGAPTTGQHWRPRRVERTRFLMNFRDGWPGALAPMDARTDSVIHCK